MRRGRLSLATGVLAALLSVSMAVGATRRVLYVTTTAGYRHGDAIDASVEVFEQLAKASGVLEIVHTEDVSLITAENLRNFDAVYFFTSGELPLSVARREIATNWIRLYRVFYGMSP